MDRKANNVLGGSSMQLALIGIVFSSPLYAFMLMFIFKGSLPVTEGTKDKEHFIYINIIPIQGAKLWD